MLSIVLLEVDDVVGLEHTQTFATTQLVLRYQHVDAVLVPFAVVSADAGERIYRVIVTAGCCFGVRFLPFVFFGLGVVFLPRGILEVNGKKLLIEFFILNLAIDNSLVI